MKASAREQANLIIDHEAKLALRNLATRLDGMLRQQAARGMLSSGNTVSGALELIGEAETALFKDLKTKLLAVSTDQDMHNVLSEAVFAFNTDCRQQFDGLMPKVNIPEVLGSELAIRRRFEEHRSDLDQQLAIALFDFNPSNGPSSGKPATGVQKPLPPVQHKGGRPKADFWEEMWVAIASALYDGTLKPKTQADIERAMAEWISARGASAADSTVRERARRLWRSIED